MREEAKGERSKPTRDRGVPDELMMRPSEPVLEGHSGRSGRAMRSVCGKFIAALLPSQVTRVLERKTHGTGLQSTDSLIKCAGD